MSIFDFSRKCPHCGKNTMTYKIVAASSLDDPLLCDFCRQMVFQYRFVSEIGPIVGGCAYVIGLPLLFFEEWFYGIGFLALSAVSFLGTQYWEVRYTSLRKVSGRRQKINQAILSWLGLVIAVVVFLVFLKALPDDNSILNLLVLDLVNAVI
jgi:hypothetical protein